MSRRSPFGVFCNERQIGEKTVAVKVPLRVADYLTLYCLYRNTSKSAYIRNIIQERLKGLEDEEIMINTLANRAYAEWQRRLDANSRSLGWADYVRIKRFRQYEEELKRILRVKRMPVPYIDRIIKRFENLYGIG
jgi:predicted DNA-binding protein